MLFAATGITDGTLFAGVRFERGTATTYSIVTRSETGTQRWIRARHRNGEKWASTPDAFWALAVGAMLGFYALEHRKPWFVLAFAGLPLRPLYGFLIGAWPFGMSRCVGGVALRRWIAAR